MLLYPAWYRRRGIRRLVALTAPVTQSVANLTLPRGAVLAYMPEDSTSLGISKDDPLVKAAERIVYVEHVKELLSEIGNPKPVVWSVEKHMREYQRTNRGKIRPLLNPETVMSNPRTFVVENFAPLQFIKRYNANFYASYYKWVNIKHTMWIKMNEVATNFPERHLFIKMQLPEMLPNIPALLRAERSIVRNTLEKFPSNESLDVLDIWTWLGTQRSESPMGHLATENLDKINLLLIHKDRWFCINLGLLNAWRKSPEAEEGTDEGLDSFALQKRFLRGLMHLVESRTIVELDAPEPESESGGDVDEGEEGTQQPTNDTPNDGRITDGRRAPEPPKDILVPDTKPELVIVDDSNIANEISDVNFDDESAELLREDYDLIRQTELSDAKIDEELAGLENLELLREDLILKKEAPVTLIKISDETWDIEQGIMDKANDMADAGLLSGSEFKRVPKLASTYKTLPNPYGGEGTLADAMAIDPESLKMTTVQAMPTSSEIFDPRILESTLFDFDSRYVEEVMPKDIINSVMSVQNAGIAVTNYEVEEVEDVMNNYEIHAIKLAPVTGISSTVRFRVPKIKEDGTYFANGVRYHLRKQRGDGNFSIV